jgi:uncharacterized small protein (DUF1192 family)
MTSPGEFQRLHDHITTLEVEVQRLRAEDADMVMADLTSSLSYNSRSGRNYHINTLQAEVERLRTENRTFTPTDSHPRPSTAEPPAAVMEKSKGDFPL